MNSDQLKNAASLEKQHLVKLKRNLEHHVSVPYWNSWIKQYGPSLDIADLVQVLKTKNSRLYQTGELKNVLRRDVLFEGIYRVLETDIPHKDDPKKDLMYIAEEVTSAQYLAEYLETESCSKQLFLEKLLKNWYDDDLFTEPVAAVFNKTADFWRLFQDQLESHGFDASTGTFEMSEDELFKINKISPKYIYSVAPSALEYPITQIKLIAKSKIAASVTGKKCTSTESEDLKDTKVDNAWSVLALTNHVYNQIVRIQSKVLQPLIIKLPLLLASFRAYTNLFDRQIHVAAAEILGVESGGHDWIRFDLPVDAGQLRRDAKKFRRSTAWVLDQLKTPPALQSELDKLDNDPLTYTNSNCEFSKVGSYLKQVVRPAMEKATFADRFQTLQAPNTLNAYFPATLEHKTALCTAIDYASLFMSKQRQVHFFAINAAMLIIGLLGKTPQEVYRGVPAFTITLLPEKRIYTAPSRRLKNCTLQFQLRTEVQVNLREKLVVGDAIHFNQFLSTALNFTGAANFTKGYETESDCSKCCMFHFELPKHYPCLALKPFSLFKTENEILLPLFVFRNPKIMQDKFKAMGQNTEKSVKLFQNIVENFFDLVEQAQFVVSSKKRDPFTGYTTYKIVPLNGF